MIGEVGINNFGVNYDPMVNGPSADPNKWIQMKSAVIDFLTWATAATASGPLNGVIGTQWYGYIPGPGLYDLNTMNTNDGKATAWGILYQSYFLIPATPK